MCGLLRVIVAGDGGACGVFFGGLAVCASYGVYGEFEGHVELVW